MMRIVSLIVLLSALVVLIIIVARLIQRRLRSGSPVDREFKDEWLGDDTDDRDDD